MEFLTNQQRKLQPETGMLQIFVQAYRNLLIFWIEVETGKQKKHKFFTADELLARIYEM